MWYLRKQPHFIMLCPRSKFFSHLSWIIHTQTRCKLGGKRAFDIITSKVLMFKRRMCRYKIVCLIIFFYWYPDVSRVNSMKKGFMFWNFWIRYLVNVNYIMYSILYYSTYWSLRILCNRKVFWTLKFFCINTM